MLRCPRRRRVAAAPWPHKIEHGDAVQFPVAGALTEVDPEIVVVAELVVADELAVSEVSVEVLTVSEVSTDSGSALAGPAEPGPATTTTAATARPAIAADEPSVLPESLSAPMPPPW
ncbi:hypothetical protein AWC02_06830 [Mycolicibacter engbaekii]|uniref:Uncharacterized protein n=1 Tax=Mycolicibacter engbaekii TaxID=188915 RepID=A0A1X1TXM2_9MYCO|nr:hypothetical protein [Mycolicibacter engbaekii]ORV49307.1 hypothetical protein AWC02_06830 [Mycolicibacter engbaekii]